MTVLLWFLSWLVPFLLLGAAYVWWQSRFEVPERERWEGPVEIGDDDER